MTFFVRPRLTLLLLLVCVGSSTGTVIFWESWAHNKKHSGVLHDTGYPYQLLALVWSRPGVRNEVQLMKLISPFVEYEHVVVGGAEMVVALSFYAALWYMHMYPSAVAFGQRVWQGFGRLHKDHFYDMVCEVIVRFATLIRTNRWSEIDYNWRFHPLNHGVVSLLDKFVTCFVDTTPFFVSTPTDRATMRRLFAPKYDACVYKTQVCTEIVCFCVDESIIIAAHPLNPCL